MHLILESERLNGVENKARSQIPLRSPPVFFA